MSIKVFVARDDCKDVLSELASAYIKKGTDFAVKFINNKKMAISDVSEMMINATCTTDVFNRLGPSWWEEHPDVTTKDLIRVASDNPTKYLKSIVMVNPMVGLSVGYNNGESDSDRELDYKVAIRW